MSATFLAHFHQWHFMSAQLEEEETNKGAGNNNNSYVQLKNDIKKAQCQNHI